MDKHGRMCFLVCALSLLVSGPVFAASGYGIDTPGGTSALPFSIAGTQVMTLTGSGLSIAMGASAPTQALDVNGYFRLRSINGEGGTIQLDGNNGSTVWVENINGTFRLINSPWNLQTFSVDQSGNGNFTGGSLTVGNGGPGTLHLYGSTLYDTGDYLHLGAGKVTLDGGELVLGAVGAKGSGCSPAGAIAYDAGNDALVYCSSRTGTWTSPSGGGNGQLHWDGVWTSNNFWCDSGYHIVAFHFDGGGSNNANWYECQPN